MSEVCLYARIHWQLGSVKDDLQLLREVFT